MKHEHKVMMMNAADYRKHYRAIGGSLKAHAILLESDYVNATEMPEERNLCQANNSTEDECYNSSPVDDCSPVDDWSNPSFLKGFIHNGLWGNAVMREVNDSGQKASRFSWKISKKGRRRMFYKRKGVDLITRHREQADNLEEKRVKEFKQKRQDLGASFDPAYT
jgi:hypothetical protein